MIKCVFQTLLHIDVVLKLTHDITELLLKLVFKHQSINVETDNMGFIYLTLINLNAMFTEIIEFL